MKDIIDAILMATLAVLAAFSFALALDVNREKGDHIKIGFALLGITVLSGSALMLQIFERWG